MKKYIPTILISIAILFVVVFIARALMAPESSQTSTSSSELSQQDKDALKTCLLYTSRCV